MLQGFRWQLLALLAAAALFALVLALRSSSPAEPEPPAVTAAAAESTPIPEPEVEQQPLPEVPVTAPQVESPVPLLSDVPTYREALVGQVQRLNPLLAGLNPVDRDITSLIFEGLVRINEYGEPVPALAREWVTSSDGLEFVFVLRDDVLWQDGTPFTADDVDYTMSLLRSPDFPGPAEVGAFWRTVETEKLGPHLVRFRLTQPLGSFPFNLTIGILPYHALQGTTAARLASHPFNLTPIGTGPYQLEAFASTGGGQIDAVHLRVSPLYRQRPGVTSSYALERISFYLYDTFDEALTALQNGLVDGLAAPDWDQRPQLFSVPGIDVYNSLKPVLGVLIFNWDEGEDNRFFQDQRVRLALQASVNRDSIVERGLPNRAVPADSPLLPGSWAYTPDLPRPGVDLAAALDYLRSAVIRIDGEAPPEDGLLYSFTILTADHPALVSIAQEIATQWSQVPLRLSVTVEAVDSSTLLARLENGEFDTVIVELPLGADPDVYAYWHQGQYPDGLNYGSMADDRISEVLERARRDPSGTNRVLLYRQFQQLFISRGAALPLYYPLFSYAVRTSVSGVQVGFIGSPQDRFRTIGDWSLLQG